MTGTLRCAVTGYASLDRKYLADQFHEPGRTTLVAPASDVAVEPGAAYYFARAVAAVPGVITSMVSWCGADSLGELFADSLSSLGVQVGGLSVSGTRSPSAYMVYDSDGSALTFFDSGDFDMSLTEAQRREVEEADAVLVGIGPPEATAQICSLASPEAFLLWAVKADPASVPPELARQLAHRAHAISLSVAEREFVEELCGSTLADIALAGTTVFVTDGHRGVEWFEGADRHHHRGGVAVSARDMTGAGDTFAGTLLAHLAQGTRATDAVTAAAAAAAALLMQRNERKTQ